MKYLFLLLFSLIIACGNASTEQCENVVYCLNTATNQQVARCGPCDDTPPTWGLIQSEAYKPEVGLWHTYYCPDRNYERVDADKSVVMGLGGYNLACLMESDYLDVSSYPAGTMVRVEVMQKGGSSTLTDTQFYTHLYVRLYDDMSLNGNLFQLMKLMPNSDYQSSYTFELPISAKKLNLVLGVDPAYIANHGDVANQPTVQLKTVNIEALM